MTIKIIYIFELKDGDIISSIYSNKENKWLSKINEIYISNLKIKNISYDNNKWLLYLYDNNLMTYRIKIQLNINDYEKVSIII